MKQYDVIVIGAGPAGIFSAIFAAKNHRKVLLIEKNEIIGRKILATGNGRCNLTNRNIEINRYHGLNKKFIQITLENFDQFKTMEFFESLGITLKEEDRGRIFPRSNQASTVVDALKHELLNNNVQISTSCLVKSIDKTDNKFLVKTESETLEAKKLIVTTGGKAAFQFGSSGDGMFWAKKLGHSIIPIYAALVPLETKESWVRELQGIKIDARLTSTLNGEILKETTGDIIFTHFGVSGPAAMAQGGTLSLLLDKNEIKLEIDLYPEILEKDLDKKLEEILKHNHKKNIKNALLGLFPAGLVPIILSESSVDGNKNAAEISRSERNQIVKNIKNLTVTVMKVRPLKEAQVSMGGIDTTEINENTLESKVIPGLYFAGEILDVDADSGGFNLQWAWSSGYLAGQTK